MQLATGSEPLPASATIFSWGKSLNLHGSPKTLSRKCLSLGVIFPCGWQKASPVFVNLMM